MERSAGRRPEERLDVEALAAALGGDVADEQRFTAASETLRATASNQPDLEVVALNAEPSTVYVGGPKLSQIGLLNSLGVRTVGPTGEDNAYWGQLSWEKVADYPADVVLAYTASTQVLADAPVYQRLPAVRAGQVIGWDDKMPFTYQQYGDWLTELSTVLGRAKVVTG